jgi:hypothetical protein
MMVVTIDRPDESRELAGDRRGDDRWPLAFAQESADASAQPGLRHPCDLPSALRCGCLAQGRNPRRRSHPVR